MRLSGTFQGTSSSFDTAKSLFILLSDVKYLYMVLEYIVGGEFFTHLRKAGRFDHTAAKFYGSQIISPRNASAEIPHGS